MRSFKDENFIYFLVEYVKGLELFDVIREIGNIIRIIIIITIIFLITDNIITVIINYNYFINNIIL